MHCHMRHCSRLHRCAFATIASERGNRWHGLITHAAKRRRESWALEQPLRTKDVGFPFGSSEDIESSLLRVNGKMVDVGRAIEIMAPCINEDRLKRIDKAAENRTFTVLPVLERPSDMGNLAACCRTAEGLGFGAFHCIHDSKYYRQSSRCSKGADKWLDIHIWTNTEDCLRAIKAAGYQIVVTHMGPNSVPIGDVDFTRKTAVILGNELSGVSQVALDQADVQAVIPMMGFVQSFNVSNAVALIMYEAHQQRVRALGRNGDLSAAEQQVLKAVFMMKSLGHASTLISELIDRPPPAFQYRELRRFDQASWRFGSGGGGDGDGELVGELCSGTSGRSDGGETTAETDQSSGGHLGGGSDGDGGDGERSVEEAVHALAISNAR